ncbi:TIGR04222 domain-containing membrane protein [Streptomyces sp. NPDC057298]|uniref:TIGR04222 domain-containing membrane protein n=1 Tax=Streptomyces sp. NPDC057298 TaxID=3346091 RepID=UPI0036364E5A
MGIGFRRSASAMEEPGVLDAYDVAFLAGGAQRVVDSAMIALSDCGLLKLSGSRVRAVGAVGEALPQHPVECALIALCPRNRSAASVLAALQCSPEVQEIARRLAARGLVAGSRHRSTRLGRRQLRSAERGEGLPDYVFGGPAVLPDGLVRRGVVNARPVPSGLGRALIRMGKALDHDSDSGSGSDSDADSGSAFSCGGGSGSH